MAGPMSPQSLQIPWRHPRAVSQELRTQRDVLTFAIADEEYAIGVASTSARSSSTAPSPKCRASRCLSPGLSLSVGWLCRCWTCGCDCDCAPVRSARSSRILVISRPATPNEMLVDEERERFGLIVDRVNDVVRIHGRTWTPTVLSGHESDFIEGIGRLRKEEEDQTRAPIPSRMGPSVLSAEAQRIIILLDLLRVLSFEHAGSMRKL